MHLLKKRTLFYLAGSIFLILFFFLVYKIYVPRVNAFGCFDDCFNFMGGYFLLDGKQLYSQIFFNHAPLMAFISSAIQLISHPQSIYELVLRHRQFVLLFGLVMELLLFFRFGLPALGFALFYELTKFYVFGDRFLGEGIVVYPLVYMAGVAFEKMKGKTPLLMDVLFAAVATWLVLFTREPYILVALFLFVVILQGKKQLRAKIVAVALFLGLYLATFFLFNPVAFIFNVVTVNMQTIVLAEGASHSLLSNLFLIFFYPLSLFFGGIWGFFRWELVGLDILFLLLIGQEIYKKQWKSLLVIVFALGLANLRFVPPGLEYYAAFHQIVWYGLFLFFSFLILGNMWQTKHKTAYSIGFFYLLLLATIFVSPSSFLHDHVNPQEEYITNYGIPLQIGTVIADLSTPKSTLFLDGTDDIIYWVAHKYSDYPYAWYTSIMPSFAVYRNARLRMFATNPPDFYYDKCTSSPKFQNALPKNLQDAYIRLLNDGSPSCLWVKKSYLPKITPTMWQKAKEALYTRENNL